MLMAMKTGDVRQDTHTHRQYAILRLARFKEPLPDRVRIGVPEIRIGCATSPFAHPNATWPIENSLRGSRDRSSGIKGATERYDLSKCIHEKQGSQS